MYIHQYSRLIFIFLSLFFINFSHAKTSSEWINQLKKENVVDTTGTLSHDEIIQLKQKNQYIYEKKRIDIKILMIDSLNQNNIDNYAYEIFNTLKIGNKKDDNGILILVALNDRKVRIEVGRGLEGNIPDIYANRIIHRVIQPNFRDGLYYSGLQLTQESIESLSQGFYLSEDGRIISPQLLDAKFYFYISWIFVYSAMLMFTWYSIQNSASIEKIYQDRDALLYTFILFCIGSAFSLFSSSISIFIFYCFLALFSTLNFIVIGYLYKKDHLKKYYIFVCFSILFLSLLYLFYQYVLYTPKYILYKDIFLVVDFILSKVGFLVVLYILIKVYSSFPTLSLGDKKQDFSSSNDNHETSSSSSASSFSSSSNDNDRDTGGSSSGGGASGSW